MIAIAILLGVAMILDLVVNGDFSVLVFAALIVSLWTISVTLGIVILSVGSVIGIITILIKLSNS